MAHNKIDIYNEVDNFVEENEGEVTNTEIARHFFELGRNNAIDEACEWLDKRLDSYNISWIEDEYCWSKEIFLKQFKQAMEGD